ncbi:vascular endothelial growth factor receptor 2 isoform X2 [Paramormyrops kingsleyae]|uniref:vascular endothelial growth factor receptor 2 isoform X2 n=1 Tax=Paramormyrops kingsleyae TaxID=1676925 RepID=UPI000CD5F074|nr:vascular endothelial growth factor receptor 2 isoform X2 [Paramormyrops kingsleyae]
MRTALIVIYFVGILHVSRTIALQLQFTPDPPVLNTAEEVYRINSTDSLELTCSGQQHVEWSTHQDLSDGRLVLTDCSGSGLFCSSLTIHKAVANDTNLYRCFYRDLPVEDGKTSTSVYVFVQDYNIPLIPTPHNIDVVFIRTGESVVIPCLGSIENLNVTLHMFPPKQLLPDGKEVFWNSRKGFTVPSHLISGAGLVFCQTQIHNETFQSSLYILTVVGYMIYQLMLTPTQQRLVVGERLVLNCTAHTELNVGIDFRWTFPAGQDLAQPEIRPHKKRMMSSLELSNMLVLENVTLNHTGEYTCSAYSGQMVKNSTASVMVYEKPFIVLSDDGPSAIEATVGERLVKIPVKYDAYPAPNVIWLKNGQPALKDEMKYRMRQEKDALIISDVAERDAGNYTVILRNLAAKEERTIQLLVNVPPQIYEKEVAEDNDIHIYGSSPILRCTARGHPSPVHFSWQWMPQEDCPHNFLSEDWRSSCNKWRDITNNTGQNPTESPNTITDQFNKTISSLRIQRAEVHALYRCEASNKVGRDQRVIFFHVTRGLALDMLPSSEPIEHDNVALRCKADKLIYGNLRWFWLGRNMTLTKPLLPAQSCRTLALPAQPLSQAVLSDLEGTNVTLELRFPNVSQHHQGLYVCQVVNIKTKEKTCLVRALTLKALQAAKIMVGPSEQRVNASDTASLTCQVTGTPMPTIVWTKNNQTLVQGSGVILTQGNQTLTIQRVKKEDSGLYTCTACNAQGCDASHASLMVEGVEEKTTVELIVPIGSVVIAMFFWLLIVFVVRNRKRPRDSELKTGYLSIILDSEDMPVEEQCERLTYDPSKWEFPRDRLKLGEPLGRGAFGQVVEAAAFGIEKAATCTTVAVKMLKEGATSSEYRALMSELKILIHIGHHLNVVNLLGACTKPGGPLMVIVEYCKYGNLSSYLKSKRSVFIPFKRKPLRSPADEDLTRGDLGFGMDPPRGRAVYSAYQNDVIVCHQGEEGRGDVNRSHLTMEDLISYSFQVAKGMDFLSSRKCIHRDLAARNILLSENNVVKICDFGLARDVYKDPDYVRKGDARLPLKWMAPETIFDRVYTTQSDVWSFGVLLWEIFSLGASPYPGVPIDEAFCQRLKDGTRMRTPEYASPEIYQIMLGCWLDQAKERPTFPELVQHLGDLLQASAKQDGKDYIPLTPGRLEGTSGALLPVPPQPRELQPGASEPLNHYDNAPYFRETHFRFSQKSDRCSQPISRRTFEAVPLEQGVITNAQLDIGMGLSPEDAKSLEHPASQTPTFSPLIRCKSKESLGSESSNPTSGYQSGYHSDDADVPIYANEEIILKTQGQAKAPLRACVKFTTEVRYSAPPV